MLVLLVVLTPPFLFFLVERFFLLLLLLSLWLTVAAVVGRPCFSIWYFFFFLSPSRAYIHSNRQCLLRSLLSFFSSPSLSFLRREKEKKEKNHYDGYPPNDVGCENVY